MENTQSIKFKRNTGMALFVLGCLLASIAAAKMPTEGTYPDTLVLFFVAFTFGVIGNVLWHKTQREMTMIELEEHKNDADSNPLALLKSTVPQIEKLITVAKEKEGMEFCDEVDNVLDNFVHPFTDKRQTFSDILGQMKGAEILLIVAYGERMLNRAWSAASDGHMEEARISLDQSLHSYQKAVSKLD